LIVDAGSGRVVAELDFGSARPHWVRETDDGIAVVGTDRGIYGFELTDGSRRWLIDEPVQRTEEAWSFPGRLIVMDSASQLWQIETETGELSRSPLDSRGRLQKDSGEIEVVAAGDHAVMALPRGLVIFDRRGELTGLDQRDGLTRLGPRAFSQRYAVALDPHGFEPRLYELRLLELETGRLRQSQRLELPTRPQRVDLIDGRILISAGTGTLVIDAPGPDEPEGPVDSR
jgi:hypothetical protein